MTRVGIQFSLGLLLLLGCSEHSMVEPATTTTESGTLVLTLTPAELQNLQRRALDGDIEASHRVAEHWRVLDDSERLHSERMFWLQVAAENGDPASMLNYGLALARTNDAADCRRALFWIRRWVATGDVPPEQVDQDGITYWEKEVIQRLAECE